MRESLQLYGHRQPELFYTDNMADKGFLESSFPSLLEDVVPVQKYANLEPFRLPASIAVFTCAESSSINTALSTILNQVPIDESESDIVVGYDSEWKFIMSDHGQTERGNISVIQIAFESRVYILQVRI